MNDLLLNANNAEHDERGFTPLHFAQTVAEAKAWMAVGADPNVAAFDHGDTALHCAALSGNHELVDYLLSVSADPNARDDEGETPMFWALTGAGSAVLAAPVCRSLVRAGASLDARNVEGQSIRELCPELAGAIARLDFVDLYCGTPCAPGGRAKPGRL